MMLATREDYDYPHIDWHCKTCGEVYCCAGYPPETRCPNGHGAGWRPESAQVEVYIDFLESLEVSDGIVIAGDGPAALMGPIAETGDCYLITKSIDSPSRKVKWDSDSGEIEWCKANEEHEFYRDVYHVGGVEIQSVGAGSEQ